MVTKNNVEVAKRENSALMRKPEPAAFVTPLADIYETDDAYVVMVDMPGATKESIGITLDKSSLVIKSVNDSLFRDDARILHSEIVEGNYLRTFNLTEGIDRDNVDARFESGVLTMKLFKKEEIKPREVRIQ